MLQVSPHGLLLLDFTILREGRPLAEVEMSWLRHRAEIKVGDLTFSVHCGNEAPNTLVLESDGQVVASARPMKTGAFPGFEIDTEERKLELRRISRWGWGTALFEGQAQLGTIERRSLIRQRTWIDLPDDLPVAVQVFLSLVGGPLAHWPSEKMDVRIRGAPGAICVAATALSLSLCLAIVIAVTRFPRGLSERLVDALDLSHVVLGLAVSYGAMLFGLFLSSRKRRK